jgi:integrase
MKCLFAPIPVGSDCTDSRRAQVERRAAERVDRYRRSKVRESHALEEARQEQLAKPKSKRKRLPRPLSNGSINKTIRLLATILEQAVEYGHIDRNPARGRKRLLRESKPSRTFLQPEQVAALLKAAAQMDEEECGGNGGRRQPLLAVLVLAGLRISEALDLRWRDVDLPGRKLRVVAAKTDAGVREVDMTPALQELLSDYRLRSHYRGANSPSSPPAGASGRTRPTFAIAFSQQRSSWPTKSLRRLAVSRSGPSRPTRCGARSSRCCSPQEPMCPTSWPRRGIPTRR